MFSTHVTREFSAYCHGELSPEDSRRVAEHLIGCARCRLEFEEVKLGVRFAGQLPLVPAPDSFWTEIETALDRRPASLNALPRRSFLKPALAIAATIALLLLVGSLWLRPSRHEPGRGWEVARLEGTPRIGSSALNDKGKLVVGQWLETDAGSRARLEVADIGQVQIDPNTRVRLIETNPTEHRLELARGRMSARVWAPPKLFFVNTPSAVAEDLGCAYTLEVDDAGNSLLRVTFGWVSLQLRDRESMVPAGAACATRPGIGPGTPYFEDASETFRATLTKLDFETSDRTKHLASLLSDARVRDTLTLWHLLSRVDGNDRALVFARMFELAPPPSGVTREGVLALDPQMLNAWRNELEGDWGEDSLPAMKIMKKVWIGGPGKLDGQEGKK